MPIAFPRVSGGYASLMTVSVKGMIAAAAPPCTARAAMRAPRSAASAAAAEESPNTTNPMTSTRRRPNRSPRPAAVIRRQAKAR
jgi:hypothetical protein